MREVDITRMERLTMLEDMLRRHKELFQEITFNINCWLSTEPGFNSCGSAACALGSAGLYPPFVAQGLVTHKIRSDVYYIIDEDVKHHPYGVEAGELFFHISPEESERLFLPDYYQEKPVTAEAVADRVQELIQHYSTEGK